jgi:hypothetical protein
MNAILLPILLTIADIPATPDVAVVCPAAFRAAMQPWVDRRTQQGHVVNFVSNLGTAAQIRNRIRDSAKSGKLRYVLLVGDPTASGADAAKSTLCTPTFRIPSKVTHYFGAPPELDTDNPYADLDDDGVPELAIGRLTAHSEQELAAIVKKILAYEDSHDFGPWRARINFVAGEGGYTTLVDSAAEYAVRRLISWDLPKSYRPTLTDALWYSPCCPDPHRFHDCCLERLNEGCLFWVFMGHGSPRSLQWAQFPNGATPILRCEDCAQLHASAPPIALLMCCYTGDFSGAEDCLAEDLLRAPGGPVAVFSGSSETLPYGMAAMAHCAIYEYFEKRPDTLGQWLLDAKRDTMAGYNLPIWSLADAATLTIAPTGIRPKEERFDHLQLFNLLGDPTMALYHPREMKLELPKIARASETITVAGDRRILGPVSVDLVTPIGSEQLVQRQRYDATSRGRTKYDAEYLAANGKPIQSVTIPAGEGRFSADLEIPATAIGNCRVRVFVEGERDCAIGASDLVIETAGKD